MRFASVTIVGLCLGLVGCSPVAIAKFHNASAQSVDVTLCGGLPTTVAAGKTKRVQVAYYTCAQNPSTIAFGDVVRQYDAAELGWLSAFKHPPSSPIRAFVKPGGFLGGSWVTGLRYSSDGAIGIVHPDNLKSATLAAQPQGFPLTPRDDISANPEDDGTKCNADVVQDHIGHDATSEMADAILAQSGARTLRWGPPNSMWTMDYREDRVNVRYGEDNIITEITCG